MKILGRIAVLSVLAVAGLVRIPAQEDGQIVREIAVEPVSLPPLPLPLVNDPAVLLDSGTFWSAQLELPPYPYLPLRELDLKVYSLGGNHIYVYDDRAVNYEKLNQVQQVLQLAERAAKGLRLEEEPKSPTVAYRGLVAATNDLQIDIESATNGVVSLTVLNPTSMTNNPVWDLYATTNFSRSTVAGALNATNWVWLARTEPGQTNLLVPMLSATEEYFRLAGTNDTDGDFLTDAYEVLVSHSDPMLTDSDGDGMPDQYEWVHFGTFAQTATSDFDGDGVGNLAEMNAGFDPALPDSDGDGRIDQLFRVKILSPQ